MITLLQEILEQSPGDKNENEVFMLLGIICSFLMFIIVGFTAGQIISAFV